MAAIQELETLLAMIRRAEDFDRASARWRCRQVSKKLRLIMTGLGGVAAHQVDLAQEHLDHIAVHENDPFREEPVVRVTEEHRKKIKYSCAPCKPVSGRKPLPCMEACDPDAISHSW